MACYSASGGHHKGGWYYSQKIGMPPFTVTSAPEV